MDTESTDWVPGEPLHERVHHNWSGYIFNFRDAVETETCLCVDAAAWPTPDRRLDPLLTFADIVCALRDDLATRLLGPRCGWCWQRTRRMVAHCELDHADELT